MVFQTWNLESRKKKMKAILLLADNCFQNCIELKGLGLGACLKIFCIVKSLKCTHSNILCWLSLNMLGKRLEKMPDKNITNGSLS